MQGNVGKNVACRLASRLLSRVTVKLVENGRISHCYKMADKKCQLAVNTWPNVVISRTQLAVSIATMKRSCFTRSTSDLGCCEMSMMQPSFLEGEIRFDVPDQIR